MLSSTAAASRTGRTFLSRRAALAQRCHRRVPDSRRCQRRTLSSSATEPPPPREARKAVTKQERAARRAARKERAALTMQAVRASEASGSSAAAASESAAAGSAAAAAPAATAAAATPRFDATRMVWYLGLGVPTALLAWGLNDENSPPAKLSRAIGLTGLLTGFTDEFAKPANEKLLPDWDQMPNVPHDIPVPHTLVLDLENTLVSSTWDRKYGWRHAKRPGVDKFLHDMAQYYEIVLYSPSIDAVAEPVVNSLDKTGCIMHRLFRDATYYMNGVHVKDLSRLNRNVRRMVALDDDPEALQLNPENLIRVKPYEDPTDRADDTLMRISPLLIEIAREGYDDIPAVLRQFRGMDADEIADEQDRRIERLRESRERRARRGLGSIVHHGSSGSNLPEPELSPEPVNTTGAPAPLTSKDLVGAAPPTAQETSGVIGWMNRRNKEKEEQNMRKMEKWNEVMLKKQEAKKREEEERARAIA